jgi:hypothetical protein
VPLPVSIIPKGHGPHWFPSQDTRELHKEQEKGGADGDDVVKGGLAVGMSVGKGVLVGAQVGIFVGTSVRDGVVVGTGVGAFVGKIVGEGVGASVGTGVGGGVVEGGVTMDTVVLHHGPVNPGWQMHAAEVFEHVP